MDTHFESIFQQRLPHCSALGLITGSVRNGATRDHLEAFAIKPPGATDDFVDDVLGIAAIRQSNELARGRIHGFEGIRAEPCARRRESPLVPGVSPTP